MCNVMQCVKLPAWAAQSNYFICCGLEFSRVKFSPNAFIGTVRENELKSRADWKNQKCAWIVYCPPLMNCTCAINALDNEMFYNDQQNAAGVIRHALFVCTIYLIHVCVWYLRVIFNLKFQPMEIIINCFFIWLNHKYNSMCTHAHNRSTTCSEKFWRV